MLPRNLHDQDFPCGSQFVLQSHKTVNHAKSPVGYTTKRRLFSVPRRNGPKGLICHLFRQVCIAGKSTTFLLKAYNHRRRKQNRAPPTIPSHGISNCITSPPCPEGRRQAESVPYARAHGIFCQYRYRIIHAKQDQVEQGGGTDVSGKCPPPALKAIHERSRLTRLSTPSLESSAGVFTLPQQSIRPRQ